jgi:prepilin-type N-terminal cleavage/methylation domain-containing protein
MIDKLAQKTQKGFTIIEVMIVLAIAGLILVVVLVAIPQLQASQRDSARRDVTNRFIAEAANYSTNNNGRTPFTSSGVDSTFTSNYLANVDLANPSTGNQYAPAVQTDTTLPASDGTADDVMAVYPGATCNGEAVTGTISATARVFAVVVNLDRAGTYYCADNN